MTLCLTAVDADPPLSPYLGQPTIDQRRAALKDDAVTRAIDEYNKLLFTKGKGKAKGTAAPTMLAYGPDHPKGRL
jgi:hypothetical protein